MTHPATPRASRVPPWRRSSSLPSRTGHPPLNQMVNTFKSAMIRKRSTILAVLVAAVIMAFGASTAQAATSSAPAATVSSTVTALPSAEISGGDGLSGTAALCGTDRKPPLATKYLPMTRWAPVTSMHTRVSDGISVLPSVTAIQRSVAVSGTLSIGNGMWLMTESMVSWANNFCIGDATGRTIDKAVASIGQSLAVSGVLAALLIAGLFGSLWRARRGNGGFGSIAFKYVLVVAILTMFVTGASGTNDAGFGRGSPGWWMKSVNDTVSNLAAAPAAALSSAATTAMTDENGSNERCMKYIKALNMLYQGTYGTGLYKPASTVSMSVNSLWLQSGYTAYTKAQFGTENPYGENNACLLLDAKRGIPALGSSTDGGFGRVPLTAYAAGKALPPDSLAISYRSTEATDRAMIGWAACDVVTGGVKPEWANDAGVTEKDCNTFVAAGSANSLGEETITSSTITDIITGAVKGAAAGGASGAAVGAGSSAVGAATASTMKNSLDFPSGSDRAAAVAMKNPTIGNYLTNLQGTDSADAMTTGYVYVISSFIMLVVFGVLSLAVLAAKLAMLVIMLMSVFVLAAALLPSADPMERVLALGKSFIGVSVIAACASAVISMIAVLAVIVSRVGTAIAGQGTVTGILWTGMSPLAAIIVLRYLFKNVFKVPSPFSIKGALAYGAAGAGGAIGGAAASNMFGRSGSRMKYAAQREMLSRVPGGRFLGGSRRRGGMSPVGGAVTTGVAAGAAAAATSKGIESLISKARAPEEDLGLPTGDGVEDGQFLDPSQMDQETRLGMGAQLDGETHGINPRTGRAWHPQDPERPSLGGYDPLLDVDRVGTQASGSMLPTDDAKKVEEAAVEKAREDWVKQNPVESMSWGDAAMKRTQAWVKDVKAHPVKFAGKTALLGAGMMLAPAAIPAAAAVVALKGVRSASRVTTDRDADHRTKARAAYADAVAKQQGKAREAAQKFATHQQGLADQRVREAEQLRRPPVSAEPPYDPSMEPSNDEFWFPPDDGTISSPKA